ncbi:D-amino acid dehydrogenase [Varunaivibrio sulfuroxidans]|uniref:D-amino acid dehydrogenase n=1 Tax=Varunaivibrio sulfuroxidans TaxID=1773489 RepID=A0A4R3JE24_9PROT|nr:D-amino acid dehydrogenase [Varunaivibrio sulfuroxidans]TCS64112.1 D-amino-acid dehydrogenase [Varunaivibrio sulfuroxidans]WES31440.1 D-amino acid dehydrogenase [Varunaivibrio sulfuroxidans]
MKVIVLGAGVVGTSTAYFLAKAGMDVHVIDRQEGVARETSFANGGQIAANHAEPWAAPSVLPKALKWLGRTDAPLLYHLRLDPSLWAWTLKFLANCTPGRERRNTVRTLRIALYSRTILQRLRRETAIEYDHLARGILNIFHTPKSFSAGARAADVMSELGCERRTLDRGACLDLEPALRFSDAPFVGGTWSPHDESGDCFLFTQRIGEMAQKEGARFHFGTTVTRLLAKGNRVGGVETATGVETADAYVLSLGSYSRKIAQDMGLNLPIYPAKGYSVSIPIENDEGAPMVSITDDAHKLVLSRLGGIFRIAGTAEFAGYDTTIDPVRARQTLDAGLHLFPRAGSRDRGEYWTGLRPVTPDSVPLLGRSPIENLYLNTGHGTLGWTMAAGSGRVIADLIGGRRPEIDLTGLGIDRF